MKNESWRRGADLVASEKKIVADAHTGSAKQTYIEVRDQLRNPHP